MNKDFFFFGFRIKYIEIDFFSYFHINYLPFIFCKLKKNYIFFFYKKVKYCRKVSNFSIK
jgi:hypothetical protein